jgi:hypothetical protein
MYPGQNFMGYREHFILLSKCTERKNIKVFSFFEQINLVNDPNIHTRMQLFVSAVNDTMMAIHLISKKIQIRTSVLAIQLLLYLISK